MREAFGRQIAFLRAIAAGAPHDSAQQLRFTSERDEMRIRCHLIGAGDTEEAAGLLDQIVRTGLPAEYPIEALDGEELSRLLVAVDPDGLVEGRAVGIRRSIDRLDPTLETLDGQDPVLFPWTWSPQAVLSTLGLLRCQPSTTQLVVHIEPAVLPPDVAVFLQDEMRRMIVDAQDGEANPVRIGVTRAYPRWLHLLPRACLGLHVLLASAASCRAWPSRSAPISRGRSRREATHPSRPPRSSHPRRLRISTRARSSWRICARYRGGVRSRPSSPSSCISSTRWRPTPRSACRSRPVVDSRASARAACRRSAQVRICAHPPPPRRACGSGRRCRAVSSS